MTPPSIPLHQFIHNLEQQFQRPIPGGLQAGTRFRDLEEWTSLQALVVISSFDWDYGIIVSAFELQDAHTIQDLFDLVTRKKMDDGAVQHS